MQFEQARRDAEGPETALPTLTYLMGRIQSCTDEATLFETTTQLLRRFSGYDRVMIYRFDNSFNGVVVAEARPKALEGFVGLRFPHWDIPPQARAMMSKIPLRFIEDVNQTSVPLLAANADLPPLDISLAETRGVSPVHMQYLRNMGAAATLTLSITSRDGLWGIISFHHSRPRIPSMQIREVLTAFLGLFVSKLEALQCDAQLSLIRRIDGIRDEVIDSIDDDTQPSKLVDLGATITSVMNASGVVIDTAGAAAPLAPRPRKLCWIASQKTRVPAQTAC